MTILRKRIMIGLVVVFAAAFVLVAVAVLRLQQNEIRQELGYTPMQYQRLLGIVHSDITGIEVEPDFQMPVWENHTPYRANLADSRTVFIVTNRDDNSVACVLNDDYDLLFGMIEQGKV